MRLSLHFCTQCATERRCIYVDIALSGLLCLFHAGLPSSHMSPESCKPCRSGNNHDTWLHGKQAVLGPKEAREQAAQGPWLAKGPLLLHIAIQLQH